MADDVKQLLVRVSATTELLRSNLISAEREIDKFTKTAEASGARVQRSFVKTGQTAGAQRAGMQQLSYQIGDVSQQFALGVKPQVIFAQQAGQVIQAVQLMTGGTSKLAAFLGGPWGIALTSATVVLVPFVAKLFEAEDASKAAEEASKSLADRQLDLGNFFDKSTGKIIENSRALIANAQAQIYAKTLQLQTAKTERRGQIGKILDSSRERKVTGFEQTIDPATGNVIRTPIYSAPNSDLIDVLSKNKGNPEAIFREVAKLANSNSSAADEARKLSDLFAQETLDARDLAKFNDFAEALNNGRLPASLRDPSSSSRSGGRSSGGGRASGSRAVSGAQPEEGSLEALLAGGAQGIFDNAIEQLNTGAIKFGDTIAKLRDEDFDEARKIADRKAEYEYEVRRQAQERLQQIEARQIQYLGRLFEDAFHGGTKAIWRDFRDMGLAVISQLLARFAAAKIGGKSFDFGSAVSASLFGVLGFADGGRPPVGRASIVGERGPELFIPDVAGTIVPNGGGLGGSVSLVINAPGATAETVAMIRRELANAAPAIVEAAKAGTARQMNRKRL